MKFFLHFDHGIAVDKYTGFRCHEICVDAVLGIKKMCFFEQSIEGKYFVSDISFKSGGTIFCFCLGSS